VYSFLFVCCFQYILNVIVTSVIYGKFFQQGTDMKKNLRNVCVLWLVKYITSSVKAQIEERIFPEFIAFTRHELFTDYIAANSVIFDDVNVSGDVRDMLELTRIMRDVYGWLAQNLIPTIAFLVLIIGYFTANFTIVGVITILSTVVNGLLVYFNYNSLISDIDTKHKSSQLVNDKFEENLQNLMNIFINNKVDETIADSSEREQAYLPVSKQEQREVKQMSNWMRLNTYIASAASLILLFKQAPFDRFMSCLFIYTFYLSTLEALFEDLPNMMRLVSRIEMYQSALTEKIFHKLEIVQPRFQPLSQIFSGHIEFQDVCFAYEKDRDVVKHLNWRIQPGERIALVAKSGSGKTTLMKLLLKFYQPRAGQILLDGQPLAELDPIEVRAQINYVNQKTLLFADTIMNNMKYGNDYTNREILELLKKYNLLHIFRDCDRAPNTCLLNQIETNGSNMSMGMQKVIFLVRGLLKTDAPVCILDEPLSSIDPASRDNVMRLIADVIGNRTLIIITHDDVSSIVHRTVHLDELQSSSA
jgi:ABC-type multidrug transport system fused ATPase/permease subunit